MTAVLDIVDDPFALVMGERRGRRGYPLGPGDYSNSERLQFAAFLLHSRRLDDFSAKTAQVNLMQRVAEHANGKTIVDFNVVQHPVAGVGRHRISFEADVRTFNSDGDRTGRYGSYHAELALAAKSGFAYLNATVISPSREANLAAFQEELKSLLVGMVEEDWRLASEETQDWMLPE